MSPLGAGVRLLTALVLALLTGCAATPAAPSGYVASGSAPSGGAQVVAPVPDDGLAPARATTSLPTVTVQQLPPEAVRTLTLIQEGGPYPFPRDGAVFQNREGRLPAQPLGFYHEYTVVTPGSADRGARRIVTGADGSRFWTADHYRSFQEVVSWS